MEFPPYYRARWLNRFIVYFSFDIILMTINNNFVLIYGFLPDFQEKYLMKRNSFFSKWTNLMTILFTYVDILFAWHWKVMVNITYKLNLITNYINCINFNFTMKPEISKESHFISSLDGLMGKSSLYLQHPLVLWDINHSAFMVVRVGWLITTTLTTFGSLWK